MTAEAARLEIIFSHLCAGERNCSRSLINLRTSSYRSCSGQVHEFIEGRMALRISSLNVWTTPAPRRLHKTVFRLSQPGLALIAADESYGWRHSYDE